MKSFIPKMAGVVLFFQLNLWLCQSGLAVGFLVTPSVVSNTYVGPVTLEVTGLTNGETVVVQEFLDFDGNGVVDAGDALAGQFDLTDGQPGMVIGGVTNLNVPGDNDGAANGQITAQLNFPGGDFVQTVAGKHLFELSSPFGRFAPVTDLFTVTNFAYGQKFTGSVVNSGTNVPGAAVILFTPPRPGDHGPGNPVAGAVADNSGNYTVAAPVGTYLPVAFASNFVASLNSSPLLSLASSQTLSTNLTLTNATETISGRIADINTMAGIPGIFSGNGSQS
ncbi:MAG: hypothetical protein KGR98_08670, partial [Verrucomicrobia bacterium]|nr:hypothetical protein [Verrucomicrobiota bacterium]